MAVGLGETITVINKSGKVVSSVSSRQIQLAPLLPYPRLHYIHMILTTRLPEQAHLWRLQGGQGCIPRAQG